MDEVVAAVEGAAEAHCRAVAGADAAEVFIFGEVDVAGHAEEVALVRLAVETHSLVELTEVGGSLNQIRTLGSALAVEEFRHYGQTEDTHALVVRA